MWSLLVCDLFAETASNAFFNTVSFRAKQSVSEGFDRPKYTHKEMKLRSFPVVWQFFEVIKPLGRVQLHLCKAGRLRPGV